MKPMDSIDLTNRKPRRFKGTPAYTVRNYFIAGVIAYSLFTGVAAYLSPLTQSARDDLEVLSEARKHELEDTTEEERVHQKSMYYAYRSTFTRHFPNFEADLRAKTEY